MTWFELRVWVAFHVMKWLRINYSELRREYFCNPYVSEEVDALWRRSK
jgi:hypothetical protein